MNIKSTIIILMALFSLNLYSQENYKVMFYNLLEYPDAPPENRAEILKSILADISPDLFMVCELKSETGAQQILNESLQTSDQKYKMASYVENQSSGANLQQLVYYNSQKFTLESQSEIKTTVRDINHYIFKLNNSDIYLDAFVAHLKASQGFNNEQLRLDMVREFTIELARVPKDHFVLFAGDFNFYTSNEDGYIEILDPTNAIILKDPLNRNGNWHTNSSFSDIHTQSTRTSSSSFDNFGAGGGLDDRFDFIMLSENLLNNAQLKYVQDSYKTFGNNGNCYNKSINDSSCSGTYQQNIRNLLYMMSDHLPVLLELEMDQVLSVEENASVNSIILTQSNIVTTELYLNIDSNLLNKRLFIYNILGQKIKSINIVPAMIGKEIAINTTSFVEGIYYLSLENSTITDPIKFIKIN